MKNYSSPSGVGLVAFVALAFIAAPLLAFVAAVPWTGLGAALGPAAWTALGLSAGTAALSTALCVLGGLPVALWLRQLAVSRPVLAGVVNLVVLIPLVLSPVLTGLALLLLWGRNGLVGRVLETLSLPVAFSPAAVVIVQVFVSMPFFIAAASASLRSVAREWEEAAVLDGATRMQVLTHVVLPVAAPGIITGAVLSFARALSEYGATLTFAGNIAGQTQTIPLLVALGLGANDIDAALGAAVLLLGLYVLVVGVIVALWLARSRKGI